MTRNGRNDVVMLDKLAAIAVRYEELERQLGDPAVSADFGRVRELAQERSELGPLVAKYHELKAAQDQLDQARALLADSAQSEMHELAREELAELEPRIAQLNAEARTLLLPKDPNDQRNVIVEIRAGTGGEEAALFAADLMRMYTRYAETRGWRVDPMSATDTGIGGYKEVIFEVAGQGAYSRLKFEGGVHRVQRVPATEASGRIHTSTATVAVLPEVDEVDIQVPEKDVEIEVYKSAGAGGQNVQKNSTAVRLRHIPSGIVVQCQDERSQLQNKLRAWAILRARLYDMEQEKRSRELTSARRSMVGSGERSEKIRTYNYPQSRVTDHRIGLTSYRLEQVLNGDLDEFIDELLSADQAEKLQMAEG
jgi:peptide chain release factor 1